MTTTLDDILTDLDDEVHRLVWSMARLKDDAWTADSAAPGWSVAAQIGHLAWTDEAAVLAARAHLDRAPWDALVLAGMSDPTAFVDAGALELAKLSPTRLLERWVDGRAALAAALRALPAGQKMPWFGPPMSASSMATARFMETWAHALDVYEGLGLTPDGPTDRIRHVAHIGVRTRGFSFATHELPVPEAEVLVSLTAPSGDVWTWGPDDAPESVSGSAYDFCLLVTQRVHRDDTDLVADGAGAEAWLRIAQCFAGPPGQGRGKR